MLWTVIVVLLVLWLLGLLASVSGGLIHVLLVVAAVILVVQLLSGRHAPSRTNIPRAAGAARKRTPSLSPGTASS